jgi:protein-disulfide isomerase
MKRYLPFLLIFLVAALAVTGGVFLYKAKHEAATATSAETASANSGAVPPHSRGPAKATVVLEEFGDLQCPPCALFFAALKKIEHDYADRVRFIYRQFPMPMHNHAVEAARASEAAGAQNRFWEMADILYRNQNEWAKATDVQPLFEQYAQKIGLDLARFKIDREDNALLGRIGMDGERGRSMDVKGTPTVFINNQRVPFESMSEPGLRAALDAFLQGKSPFPATTPTPPPPTIQSAPIPIATPAPSATAVPTESPTIK